jgi:mevalonate pyrophosphate decarboxylase
MPAHKILFRHSRMDPDFIGSVTKYAHTREAAIKLLGKYDSKLNIVIDRRGSVLTLLD